MAKTILILTIAAAFVIGMNASSTPAFVQEVSAGIEPLPFIVNQLNAVANVLSAQGDRLNNINAQGSNPPDDSIPVLNSIMSECTAINAIADEMLGRAGR